MVGGGSANLCSLLNSSVAGLEAASCREAEKKVQLWIWCSSLDNNAAGRSDTFDPSPSHRGVVEKRTLPCLPPAQKW